MPRAPARSSRIGIRCAGGPLLAIAAGASGCALPAYATAGSGSSGDFPAAVEADAPLAYWRFRQDQPGGAHDETNNGHDGKYDGAPSLAPSPEGDGQVVLDGAQDSVEIGDAFPFAANAPMTVELLVNPATTTVLYPRLVSKETLDSPREGYNIVFLPSAGTLQFERWNQTLANPFCAAVAPVVADKQTHVVAVFDGTNAILYVDGAKAQKDCSKTLLIDTHASFMIGAESQRRGDGFLDGSVDEAAVYDHALSDDRVQAHCLAANVCR